MIKAKILIAEDEAIIAEEMRCRLERLDYSISGVVVSGTEAVNRAEETHPDLVLMDISLKGEIDGIEAALVIWDRLHIPVVYMTAYMDEEMCDRAKINGRLTYILKPFRERELVSAIESTLNSHA